MLGSVLKQPKPDSMKSSSIMCAFRIPRAWSFRARARKNRGPKPSMDFCQEDVIGKQLLLGLPQKSIDGFGPRFFRALARKLHALGIRKAHIIELDFIESGFGCFNTEPNIIVPNLLVEWIAPRQPFPILKCVPVLLHCPFGMRAAEHVVLERDDSSNCVKALAVQPVN